MPIVDEWDLAQTKRPCLLVLGGVDEGRLIELNMGHTVVGRAIEPDVVRLNDELISRRHAVITVESTRVSVSDSASTNGTFINGRRVNHAELVEGDTLQVGLLEMRLRWQDEVERNFAQRQYRSSKRDTLTGCYNKRHLLELLRAEFSFSQRHKKSVSVVMADLDHFKNVNDAHGHLVGDAVLKEVGLLLRDQLRNHDLLARFGGEEFVIVMRETPTDGALVVCERLRVAIESHKFAEGLKLTVSLGIACFPDVEHDDEDSHALLERADRALYRAKAAGRNRVSR